MTSPYAYVMNNPVMMIDPDGRYPAGFSSGTEDLFFEYMVNTYWRKNSSLVPDYSGTAIFGFSGIYGPTQYSSVLKYWTSALTPGKQNFNFDFYGERNGEIQGDYASVVFTQMTLFNMKQWEADAKALLDKVSVMWNSFVFQIEGKGTFGVQAGIGAIEGGIMTGDLGSFGWSNRKGGYATSGDGKGHNFFGAGASIFNLGGNIKLDYVTNDIMPTEGSDLLEYYPNNGVLNTEWGIGPKTSSSKNNDNPVIPSRPSIRIGVNNDANEDCNYCLNISYGAKILLGIDMSIKVGFSSHK